MCCPQFFVLRTLLGVAESGAFPGMWFMLSRFYPPSRITLVRAGAVLIVVVIAITTHDGILRS